MELTTTENPQLLIRRSTDVAGACKEIVTKTAIKIQNKKYVPIEGWMTIATAHGCSLSAADVKTIDGGISAIGEVRRLSDGIVLGRAEGFVGDDEKTWAGRPLFARRAMAQTRAMSRAARSVFAHVVVMMDAGLSTTPAEEMGHEPTEERDVTPPPASKPKTYENQFMEKLDGYFSESKFKDAHVASEKLIELINVEKKNINLDICKNYVDLKLEHIKSQEKYNYSTDGKMYLYYIAKTFGLDSEDWFKNKWDADRYSRG